MNLNHKQLRTLRHMLGIDRPEVNHPKSYRDYYCASRGDDHLKELARLGAVQMYRQSDGYDWYCCTEPGRTAAFESHKRTLLPKAKRLYIKFLDIKDAIPDLTFGEFLTGPEFDEARRAV